MTSQTPTLLLMEDFSSDQKLFRRYLSADGNNSYRLLEADTVRAGLELCRTETIDAILLDFLLPDANGLQFLEFLQAQSNGSSPPVVMVTNAGSEKIAVRAMKLGAEDYLVKRCLTPELLQLTVRSAIENTHLRRQLRQQENQFRVSVENMLDCFGIFSAIRDEAGQILDFRIDYMNAAALEANRMTRMVFGQGLCELLPNHRETGLFDDYCQVVETGRPLIKESLIYSDQYSQQYLTRAFDIRASKLADGFVASWRDVTEQKRSQAALEQQARLLEMVDDAVIVRDRNSAIVSWNRAATALYGWPRQEAMGHVTHQLLQTQFPIPELDLDALLHQEGRWEGELIHTCKDGSQRIVESRQVLVRDDTGHPAGFLEVNRDITGRKRTEAALLDSERRFRELFNTTYQFVGLLTPDGILLEANQTALEFAGLTREEVVGRPFWEVRWWTISPQTQQQLQDAIRRARAGEFVRYEVEVLGAGATTATIDFSLKPVRNESGQVVLLIPEGRDISERIQSENERMRDQNRLRDSEARLRVGVQVAGAALARVDYTTQTVELSPEAAAMYGLPAHELVVSRDRIHATFHQEEREMMQQIIAQVLDPAGDGWFSLDHRVVWPTGEVRWLTVRKQVFFRPVEGELRPHYAILAALDITDRKRAEATIQNQLGQIQAIYDSAPVGLCFIDRDLQFVQINERLAQINGRSVADHLGRTLWEVSPQLGAEQTALLQQVLQTGIPVLDQEVEGTTPAQPGVLRHWIVNYLPLVTQNKQVLGINIVVQEITERKRAEMERDRLLTAAQTAQAEAETANRSKDEFVAVVAHELRSPLNSMLGWAKLLRTRQFDQETINKALETIERNTLAQTQLVEDLLDISRMVSGKLSITMAPVNLMYVVETAIDQVRLQAEAKQIALNPQLNLPPLVLGDYNRLQQVVVNLLTNAIKFTPAQGRIDVELTQIETQVQLKVRDTGKGIAPEFLPYLFERFQQGQQNTGPKDGLGLGLAIVKNLIELHEGTITAESAGVNLGATFTLQLPMLSTPAIVSERPPAPMQPTSLAEVRILVVDDEPDMLDLIQFVLEECGAVVQTAASLSAAMTLLPAFEPDILLSDIAMPGGTGYDLMQTLRQYELSQGMTSLDAQIPAIALTSYASASYEERSLQAGFQKHLTKPVEPEVLVAAIAELVRLRR